MSASATASNARPGGRPRDGAIDHVVREAARRLLAERGYRALTFETLARETGVPRSMIYRRWPTKTHLANEIAVGGEASFADVIAGGGLEPQMAGLIRQIFARYQVASIAAASVGVIADTQGDRALQAELRGEAEAINRAALRGIVAAGQQAGTIRMDVDGDVLFDMIVGGIVYRTLFSLQPAPSEYVADYTRRIVASIAAPAPPVLSPRQDD
ncbi:TetR/AcrR family transcriptional regulator [Sphingomonas jatrophae]|uniref:Transcriptional regulator, TetR family n=1 Tax=Sphingomonas jatrophae TaxID=1166337 RepID=A0A1I6KBS2_9SPHN|nr:TetR/AcrR family transcriptional regulator [Sphingomonas jatrophae]SFR88692.1 transcriptional regulator, TetR family [Sphingomonas jatrophae]